MALSQQITLKQTQGLVLTPQLQQAIKILELSNLELSQYLATEMMDNPLLSLDEGDQDIADIAQPENVRDEDEIAYDSQWGESKNSDQQQSTPSGKDYILETLESKPVSLKDHLQQQLSTDIHDPIDRLIGTFLISILEETGWLPTDYAAMASNLKTTKERLDQVIKRLQQFDPAGIFARTLSECIYLQLDDRGLLTPEIRRVLDNLELIELGEIQKLETLCKITHEQLREILLIIRTCDPKPGLKFASIDNTVIIPDIIVHKSEAGDWALSLNEQTMPRVNIDQKYYDQLKMTRQQKTYISERYTSANALIKALQQRAKSILEVSKYILKHQRSFFDQGIHYLKPMTLQDVAKALEMHESTISRVTTNKFMQTPGGTFELKFFFTSSIHSLHTDNQTSSRSVQARIKELINSEDKNKPYSDDQLTVLLNEEGILAARRTVTKYRESQNIASSFQRKRDYKRKIEL